MYFYTVNCSFNYVAREVMDPTSTEGINGVNVAVNCAAESSLAAKDCLLGPIEKCSTAT